MLMDEELMDYQVESFALAGWLSGLGCHPVHQTMVFYSQSGRIPRLQG